MALHVQTDDKVRRARQRSRWGGMLVALAWQLVSPGDVYYEGLNQETLYLFVWLVRSE